MALLIQIEIALPEMRAYAYSLVRNAYNKLPRRWSDGGIEQRKWRFCIHWLVIQGC